MSIAELTLSALWFGFLMPFIGGVLLVLSILAWRIKDFEPVGIMVTVVAGAWIYICVYFLAERM